MVTCFLLAGYVLSETSHAIAQGTGRVAVYAPNPRYLQDARGKPFVIIGFGNEEKNSLSVLDQLQGKINYQRAYAAWWGRFEDPSAYKGGRPWPMVDGKADMDAWNETFWANLRDYIQNSRDRGITVGITIWDGHSDLPGGKFGSDSVWNARYNIQNIQWAYDYDALVNYLNPQPMGRSAERLVYYQRRWVDRLIAEITPYPNLLIELNNEDSSGASENWWLWWAQYFKQKWGGVVAMNNGSISDATFASTPWLDMMSYHSRTFETITPSRLSFNKVIVADGDTTCTNLDAETARRIAWAAFLYGGQWNDFVCSGTPFPDSAKIGHYGRLLHFINTRNIPFTQMISNNSVASRGFALIHKIP